MALLITLAGCNKGAPRGEVSGKVSFEGKPLTEGLILFQNATQGVAMTAPIGSDGTYVVKTAEGPGLPLGDYVIAVRPPELVYPSDPTQPPPQQREYPEIPRKYRDAKTSGVTTTINEGLNEVNVDMKSGK